MEEVCTLASSIIQPQKGKTSSIFAVSNLAYCKFVPFSQKDAEEA